MPGLHLLRSNRIEILARLLVGVVQDTAPPDPLLPIQVVVGSRGMERWLRHSLAQHLSICSNFSFPFPAEQLDAIVASLLGHKPPTAATPDPWSPEALVWALLEVLPQQVERSGQEVVRGYLDSPEAWQGSVDAKQYGLARQLAEVFDRYIAFRPELARAWSADASYPLPDAVSALGWQRSLFRAVQLQLKDYPHRARRLADTERLLRSGEALGVQLAPLLIFGVSSLPPSWLSLLGALSQHVDVFLFLLCPSDTWWSELQRIGTAAPASALEDPQGVSETLRVQGGEVAHPLLASLGRIARDFQLVLEAQPDPYADERIDAFPDPAQGPHPCALHWLQSDLLAACHPTQAPRYATRRLDASDDSVQLHSCYGPTRQVEVLRDLLLGLLEEHPDLEPRHILVMTPDIEAYAPLVTAVFSQGLRRRPSKDGKPIAGPEAWGLSGGPRIPFEVADLSVRCLNPVAEALLRVLEMVDSRLEASALLDLLTLEPVHSRFGMKPEDLPTLRRWIEQSGIRWARDAEHRARNGQPEDEQNTWQFGLRRLLLGAAMAEDGRLLEGQDGRGCATDVLPYDALEGAEAPLLGKLVDFCNTLFDLLDALQGDRTVGEWRELLDRVVERLTATPSATSWLSLRVRETLAELGTAAQAAGIERKLELGSLRAALAGQFELASHITREQSGAVTFCALRPMRSVPYPVLCLLGMDEGAFPRKGRSVAFDLTALQPRIGDSDSREEDRYLLLEAILAARRNLLVLYSGRDPHTNKETPPCVPVAELRDLIDQSFPRPAANKTPSGWLTTEHPLQGFSPRVFLPLYRTATGGALPWSFDRRLRAAAEARQQQLKEPTPFLQPSDPADQQSPLALEDLISFFRNPAKYLVHHRLRIDLGEGTDTIPDREPVELDPLAQWKLRRALLEDRSRGGNGRALLRGLRASGSLPLGYAGKALVASEARRIDDMLVAAGLVEPETDRLREADPPIPIDLLVGETRLRGTLGNVYGSFLIDFQYAAEEGRRLIGAWLALLAWHAASPKTAGRAVVVLTKREEQPSLLGFEPPDSPTSVLRDLIAIYRRGIREPIPLFPVSSYTFAGALKQVTTDASFFDQGFPSDPETLGVLKAAFESARKKWAGGTKSGEAADRYHARLFSGASPLIDRSQTPIPLNLDFARLALRVWGPIRSARRTTVRVRGWLAGEHS